MKFILVISATFIYHKKFQEQKRQFSFMIIVIEFMKYRLKDIPHVYTTCHYKMPTYFVDVFY